MRRYPKGFNNAKKVYRAKDSTLQALKERGGAPRNDKLRRIMGKYYRIVDELEDVLYYGGEDFTEEQVKELKKFENLHEIYEIFTKQIIKKHRHEL